MRKKNPVLYRSWRKKSTKKLPRAMCQTMREYDEKNNNKQCGEKNSISDVKMISHVYYHDLNYFIDYFLTYLLVCTPHWYTMNDQPSLFPIQLSFSLRFNQARTCIPRHLRGPIRWVSLTRNTSKGTDLPGDFLYLRNLAADYRTLPESFLVRETLTF